MEREQKNQLLADLYALRAGMSAISIEKDKLDKSESVYKKALNDVDRERIEYEKNDYDIARVHRGISYCNSQLPRGYLAAENDKERRKKSKSYEKKYRKGMAKWDALEIFIHTLIAGAIGLVLAAVPWFFYFVTSGAYDSDKRMHPTFENSYYKNYIYVSIGIFAIILIIGLIVSTIRVVGENRSEKKEEKANIKSAENSIRELKNELASYQLEKNASKKVLDKYVAIANEKRAVFEKERTRLTKLSQDMYDRLVAQFKTVLDIRDWQHIDLVIFYFETGRADTLKEALQQVDRKVQTDEIIDAIKTAGQNISSTIRMSMNELRGDLNRSFAKLSVQLADQHREQMSALSSISGNIEKTNESLAKLQQTNEKNGESIEKLTSAAYLNNALLTKISYDSLSLMSDVDYMVYSANKGGNVSNNTSYTLNVNVK